MKYKQHFPDFIKVLDKKLENGYYEYGDDSFKRSEADLQQEIAEELLDFAGWAFILWVRVHELRRADEDN